MMHRRCAGIASHLTAMGRTVYSYSMHLTRMRGESFVLVGFEEVKQRRIRDVFPQAWWCRVVCEATGESALADDAEVESVSSVF
jgi:hypothetical protein